MAGTGRRVGLGTIIGWAAAAAPVVVTAYVIIDRQRTMAEAGVRVEPSAETVAVEPRYADPEILKQKKESDAKLRPQYESAKRRAEAREALQQGPSVSQNRSMKPTGKTRASTVGPAPEPPEGMIAPDGSPTATFVSQGGAKIYGLPDPEPEAPPQPAPARRRR